MLRRELDRLDAVCIQGRRCLCHLLCGTHARHPDAIRRKCREGMSIALVREPRNRFDPNAIAVHVLSRFLFLSSRTHVGNLKAPLAKRLAPKMGAGAK